MKSESVFALLAGAAAGVLAGLLIAPDKGEVTREKLMDEVQDAAHDAHVRARYARREMNSLKKTLMEQGAELKEDLRSKLAEQLSRLEQALSREPVAEPADDQTA